MPVQTTYPGVYIQEAPSGVHTIVGVSTSVTAFVGSAGRGPVDRAIRVFSFADYQRAFGPPLDEARPMGHAVSHFFANGGSEAVVVRAAHSDALVASVTLLDGGSNQALTLSANGRGAWANRDGGVGIEVMVAYDNVSNPDDLFRMLITYWIVDPRTNQPVKGAEESFVNLSMSPSHPRYVLNALGTSQLVVPSLPGTLAPGPAGTSTSAAAVAGSVTVGPSARTFGVSVDFGPSVDVTLFPTATADAPKTPAQIATELTKALATAGLAGKVTAAQSGGVFKLTSADGTLDSAVSVSPGTSADLSQALGLGRIWGGTEVSGSAPRRPAELASGDPGGAFAGGSDGSAVVADDVVPDGGSTGTFALNELLFPRFNILCLPGLTSDDQVQIGRGLAYCADQRAFLVVDSPAGGFAAVPPNLGSLPALGDHGAIYYPRIQVTEAVPGGSRTLNLPPSGAVAGVMARIDTARGIWKAPAGLEAGIVGITGLANPTGAPPVDDDLSGQLNPHGVNVLRSFPAAGTVVWGARTLRGDDSLSSEFKYIPIRRLTDYLASSLYLGTQFAVFEPNDPVLWGQLRLAVGTFMRGLFRQGAFQQSEKRTESDSFFVICDATVNPQPEIDLGRVNVVVGFAPLKPAEFVVITITQISQLEG
jgi:Bacteriophage tail sheath protein